MKVESFEDLICSQKARVMTNVVCGLTRSAALSRDFTLGRQIRGAAISTMSNTAEGFERWSFREFGRFLDIAKGSAGEVRSQPHTALDQGYVTPEESESATAVAVETTKTVAGLIAHLERRTESYRVKETGASGTESALELPAQFCDSRPDTATRWIPGLSSHRRA